MRHIIEETYLADQDEHDYFESTEDDSATESKNEQLRQTKKKEKKDIQETK